MASRASRPTLVQVARAAGVDRAIVSRVLNGDPRLRIRPETRERVLNAVDTLGYRANVAARSLRTSRAAAVGLLIPDFTNPVYAEVIAGAEMATGRRHQVLLTGSLGGEFTDPESYLRILGQGRIDGLLVAGTQTNVATTNEQLPVVWLNRRPKGATRYVVLDDQGAAGLAVSHLIELGHHRVGLIAGNRADTVRRRRTGYRRALRDADIPADSELEMRADNTPAGGAEALRQLLALPVPPTAVFVANIAGAIGALAAAARAGITVPEQLSIVAVHDTGLADYTIPALTTVRMPLRALGARGVDLLAEVPAHEPIEEIVTEPMKLVVRASTAPRERTGR